MLKNFVAGFTLAALAAFSLAHSGGADYAPQSGSERDIKVTVTPRELSNEAKTWDFEVVMETHTRSLNDDLAKSSVLVADGKQYLPLGWEGAPPGGHHRKGLLRFKAIEPVPASVELQIRLEGDAAPRNFRWMLKGKGHGG